MLGLSPFDHLNGYGRPHHHTSTMGKSQPRSSSPHAEPDIDLDERDGAYLISLSAPEGYVLDRPQALLEGGRQITLRGTLEAATATYEYVTLSRTGVYAAPGRQMLGVLPARAMLRAAGPPTRSGWVELADEDGWVDTDSLHMVARPPPPRPFDRLVKLPNDAVFQRATSRTLRNGGLIVSVPRRPAQPAAATPRSESGIRRAVPPAAPVTARPAAKAPEATAPKPAPAPAAANKPATATHAAKPDAAVKRSPPVQDHAGGGALPMSKEGPVLMECDSSPANVNLPSERTQSWVASPGGGFDEEDD